MINKLSKEVHQNAVDHGFFDDEKNIGEMLCLIHSEVSEALEADRKGIYAKETLATRPDWWLKAFANKDFGATFCDDDRFKAQFKITVKDTFEDELADIMIRVMDLASFKSIDLENHVKAKMRYNSLRPYKHGKKY